MATTSIATDLTALTASQALERLRRGQLSVEAYAGACLDRIAEREPIIEAWAFLDPDKVLEAARALDARAHRGPLHGLPIGVKDVILTEDMPTQYNSDLYRGRLIGADAACVALLRQAGALVLGKTHTVEFAATGRPPPTRNPHDLARTPGGSSSGSAAAVADFHVPLALGTQTGGSIIRPASFCGVFAIKPTWGLVNRDGAKAFAPSLDTVGWFARSAADLALPMAVFDPGRSLPAFHLRGARIALCRTPMWEEASPASVSAHLSAADILRAMGADVAELDLPPPFNDLLTAQKLIMESEGAASFLADYQAGALSMHPNLRAMVEGAATRDRGVLAKTYDLAASCRARFDEIARRFDIVLTPSVVGEAPVGLAATGAMTFNAMWTLLQTPCVNVPALYGPNDMPVGLTVTGPRFADWTVLAAAEVIGSALARSVSRA